MHPTATLSGNGAPGPVNHGSNLSTDGIHITIPAAHFERHDVGPSAGSSLGDGWVHIPNHASRGVCYDPNPVKAGQDNEKGEHKLQSRRLMYRDGRSGSTCGTKSTAVVARTTAPTQLARAGFDLTAGRGLAVKPTRWHKSPGERPSPSKGVHSRWGGRT